MIKEGMNMMRDRTIILLFITIFILYVIGDYVTTAIAIENSPLGIDGEINPIAVALYNNYGMTSLLLAKIVMFVILSSVTLLILKRNANTVRMIKKVLLAFMLFSAIVVVVNTYTILTI